MGDQGRWYLSRFVGPDPPAHVILSPEGDKIAKKELENNEKNSVWNEQTKYGLTIVRSAGDAFGNAHVICEQKDGRFLVAFYYDPYSGECKECSSGHQTIAAATEDLMGEIPLGALNFFAAEDGTDCGIPLDWIKEHFRTDDELVADDRQDIDRLLSEAFDLLENAYNQIQKIASDIYALKERLVS